MNTSRLLTVTALAAALVLSLWTVSTAQVAAKARPTAVAVADVEKVFNTLKQKQQIEADLQGKADDIKAEDEKRQKKIRDLQADADILDKSTPVYQDKMNDVEQAVIELQAWRQFQTNKLNRERAVQIENLYRKMIDAIGRVARGGGYDLVLFKEAAINFAGAKPEQLSTLIQMRKVLWSKDDLDISDQVLTLMNNEFANSATAPKAGG